MKRLLMERGPLLAAGLAMVFGAQAVAAQDKVQDKVQDKADRDTSHWFALQDSDHSDGDVHDGDVHGMAQRESTTDTTTSVNSHQNVVYRENGYRDNGYREISDFFNVREAHANVVTGEWEVELGSEWVTGAEGGDDNFSFSPNIKYGLTDNLYVQLEVLPLNLGDGGDQGNGDLSLQVFYQFLQESDSLPAMAAWLEGRVPTGEGSSGVDGELHLNATKTIAQNVRGHMEGVVKTANGGRGDEDTNRRPFQWGVGVGVDYQCDDKTFGVLNFLNRNSNERGNSNENTLEIGVVREITKDQHLKFAFDVGLDGRESTEDFGIKILWSYDW